MLTFGLTGGIATGKSTINKVFAEYNIPLVDADIIARKVVEPKTEGLYALGKEFGAQYINADGSLNRSKLGDLVFSDSKARKRLDRIMFPLILEESENQIKQLHIDGHNIVGYDSALIIESGLADGFRPLIVVYCTEEQQIDRLMKRNNLSWSKAMNRICSQMPARDKIAYADYTINTGGTKEESANQALEIIKKLQSM